MKPTINHFEIEESFEEHADIFDAATAVPVYGQAYGIARNIAEGAGKIFGIGKEDKSDVGFKAYKNQAGQLPFYPTKEEVIKAAQQGKWQAVEIPAIQASYNPQDGTWKRGDWNFAVSNTSPIQAKYFKGAKEAGGYTSNVNAAVPVVVSQPQNVPQATAIHVSNMPNGSTPTGQSSPTSVTPTSQALISSNQTPATNPNGTIKTDVNGNTVFKNAGSGAADISAMDGKIPGGSTTLIVGGILLVVVIVILFIANKN